MDDEIGLPLPGSRDQFGGTPGGGRAEHPGDHRWDALVRWDGAQVRLYVDGALVATRAAPGTLLTSTGQLKIGGNALRGEFFSGLIDDVRVYDRPLSADKIGADMNAPVTP
jgi:hypothetical protein